MIASIRHWPNAPRDCLLASTPCSDVTWVARSVIFFCARSITASRSASFCRFSDVLLLGLFERIAEAMRDRIEPLVDGALELRLAIGQ